MLTDTPTDETAKYLLHFGVGSFILIGCSTMKFCRKSTKNRIDCSADSQTNKYEF